MKYIQSSPIYLGMFWLALVISSFICRSYVPIDETRYMTVAWNMYLNHDYLVPYLNGEPYSHKPPLLFWLINAGWNIFGVNNWWPRLLPSIFSLGAVLLTQKIAMRLWPERPQIAYVAALILMSSSLWAVFTTALMFDMFVAFFTVLGAFALLVAWQGEAKKGWGLFSIAIGGGLLAKGPVIFLQVLPLALLAPWWVKNKANSLHLRKWYLAILASVVVGALILLIWAIPAGIVGGPKYQHEIFWGQTANRMVESFAHKRPVYWYLPVLFVMLFPWLLALPVWRALARTKNRLHEAGLRFCWAWLLPTFIFFSLISGKQPHYLLPIFPAFALLIARGWDEIDIISFIDKLTIAIILAGLSLALFWLLGQDHIRALNWVANVSPLIGIFLALVSTGILLFVGNDKIRFIRFLSSLGLIFILTIYIGIIRVAGPAYDVTNFSRHLKTLQEQNVPLANIGNYHGQYNFVGRLTVSPEELYQSQVADWFKNHPDGRVIMYLDKKNVREGLETEYEQPYLGIRVAILNRTQWQAWSDNK